MLKNSSGRINERKRKALDRLKNPKKAVVEDSDKFRILKEIKILESRIMTPEEARGKRTKKYRGDKNIG